MGVTGLWKLLESSGKPVPLDTLENKVLAVDISIWLHQVVKGFQDNKGSALAHAHLLGLFHRLCKLLYYKIKPVFVFDGSTPILKRQTIAKRQQNRNQILNEADRLQTLLLQSLAKEKVVQQALGTNAINLISPSKNTSPIKKPDKDDIFKLPELPTIPEEQNDDSICNDTSYTTESTSAESSFDDNNLRHSYHNNIQSIDVKSSAFLNLPADVRHEILTDIRETRKQSSWGKLHELPAESNQFSSYQMKRLLKRRQVQVSLETAEKEMGGKSLTLNELRTFLTEEGIVAAASEAATKPVASDENVRYLLVRDLTKNIEKESKKLNQSTAATATDDSSIESEEMISDEKKTDDENREISIGNEYERDLEMALKMSLETIDNVYKDEDYDCNGTIKLNHKQRKNLEKSALTLARSYMIEYGGMNDDEVHEMLEKTQKVEDEQSLVLNYNDDSILLPLDKLNQEDKPSTETKVIESKENQSNDDNTIGIISSDDSDNDSEFVKISTSPKIENKKLQIHIDLTKQLSQEDDIFADIFENEEKPITLSSSSEDQKNNLNLIENKSNDLENNAKDIDIVNNNKTDTNSENNSKCIEIVEKIENKSDLLHINIEKHNQMENILENLKKEASQITNINLNDIKLDTKLIVVSDDDSDRDEIKFKKSNSKINTETIEIIDDNDDTNNNLQKNQERTPSKHGKINDFFNIDFKIKRTPDKIEIDEEKEIVKVKSPFFINRKTPESSSKKRKLLENYNSDDNDMDAANTDATKSTKRNSKVSKMLFDNETKDIIEENQSINIDPIQLAAQALKDNKTVDELETMANDLLVEKHDLENERNRQDRMGTSITAKMNNECMELLRLFGIPYIIAPMEAEAQCAFLNSIQLTDGTITDDSDIWLFGGQTVYKNFFNQKKHVLEFQFETIEKLYNINRHKLIQLAMLVGSDYTTGINGIGAVTALEILATFQQTPIKDNETTEIMSILSTLRKFRDWFMNGKNFAPGGKTALKSKLKNIEINQGFPNSAVVEAYLRPKIDEDRENFTWSHPDVETLREFARKKFGWTRLKTDEILIPVLKKIDEKKSQKSIKNYFSIKSSLMKQDLKVSKRIQNAITKMSVDYKSDDEAPLMKKTKTLRRKTVKKVEENEDNSINPENKRKKLTKRKQKSNVCDNSEPSTSGACSNVENESVEVILPAKIIKKNINIPETKQIIPQKEKTKIDMEKRKELAAKIFQKSNSKT